MTSDWARDLTERKKRELEEKRVQQEKDLSDRKLLTANAERMWDEVVKAMMEYVSEINSEMGSDYLTIEGSQHRYNLKTPQVSYYSVDFTSQAWLLSAQGTTYKLAIIEGNGVVWQNTPFSNLSSQRVAQDIVARAFR